MPSVALRYADTKKSCHIICSIPEGSPVSVAEIADNRRLCPGTATPTRNGVRFPPLKLPPPTNDHRRTASEVAMGPSGGDSISPSDPSSPAHWLPRAASSLIAWLDTADCISTGPAESVGEFEALFPDMSSECVPRSSSSESGLASPSPGWRVFKHCEKRLLSWKMRCTRLSRITRYRSWAIGVSNKRSANTRRQRTTSHTCVSIPSHLVTGSSIRRFTTTCRRPPPSTLPSSLGSMEFLILSTTTAGSVTTAFRDLLSA
mmetsp:Transcript_13961/g.33748  ORF Transcript_13961/g.33748 Transcript_13961/m.33748 type:complete len:260 (-) Transcript_13961:1039-1818(-)